MNSLFLGRSSWSEVLGNLRGPAASAAAQPADPVIALAMLTPDESFSDCNTGKLDSTFREIGNVLNSTGLRDAIVRLGWEANGDSFAWKAGNQVSAYKSCFRRLTGILRARAPGIEIEWSMQKNNEASVGAHQLYPGDDVVDIIGTSGYDRYPTINTQAQWDSAYMAKKQGGPLGLGTWLAFAREHKKKLAVAEWGISNGYSGTSSKDNPFYIQKMYEFFRNNAQDISYEAYFNCKNTDSSIYMIYPENYNPLSSKRYKDLWRAGK